jgi:hypothetical protein
MSTDREEHRSESSTAVSDAGTTAADSRQSDTAHRDQRRRFVLAAVTVPILMTLGTSVVEAGITPTYTKKKSSCSLSVHRSVRAKKCK